MKDKLILEKSNNLTNLYIYDNLLELVNLVLVAQWTRARGYEPRCRGFKSLLAHNFEPEKIS
jgi:hypothetical protein